MQLSHRMFMVSVLLYSEYNVKMRGWYAPASSNDCKKFMPEYSTCPSKFTAQLGENINTFQFLFMVSQAAWTIYPRLYVTPGELETATAHLADSCLIHLAMEADQ